MRIWDIDPAVLCRKHLLGEHRELHAVWTILTENKTGYANHPETKRWRGKLKALFYRHGLLVSEMTKRKYTHHSPLDAKQAAGADIQEIFINTPEEQILILRRKKCECNI